MKENFIFDGDIRRAMRDEFRSLAKVVTDTDILTLIDGFVNKHYDIRESFAKNKVTFLKYVAKFIAK